MDIKPVDTLQAHEFPAKGALLGGAAILGAVALSAAAGGGRAFAQAPFATDLDVLNYALTLEYFEATLYAAIRDSGMLQGRDQQYISLFAQHEQAHVDALVATIPKLGGTPVAKNTYNFPVLKTRDEVLTTLEFVEATGTSAYLGAAGYIQNKDVLAAAASIMQVEARHTALIRVLLGKAPAPDAFTPALTPAEVLKIVTPFIAS